MEVKSVAKCLKALDYILESALTQTDCGLSDIAAHLGEQSSTMRNILKTMEESGYVGRNGSKYLPGAHCNGMKRIARIAEIELNDWINRMNSIESLRNESLVIATIVNGKRIVLYRREGAANVIVSIKVDDHPALYSLVTTRIMLPFLSNDELEEFFAVNGFPGQDWPEAIDAKQRETCFAELRYNCYAEAISGELYAAAQPLFHSDGRLLGAIGVYVPKYRADELKKQEIRIALQTCTEKEQK